MTPINQEPIWKEWFNKHGSRLLLFARQQARNPADAEDIVQEAFVRMWRLYGHTGEVAPGLVYKTIRRIAIDFARKDIRRIGREEKANNFDLLENGSSQWFEYTLEKQERHEALENGIKQLSPKHQEVLMLKVWGDLTFEEIGSTLGIPLHTAASRYRHALSNLKNILTKLPK
jgi:RNA polymerase sigma-70 factor (ECF subfamily)